MAQRPETGARLEVDLMPDHFEAPSAPPLARRFKLHKTVETMEDGRQLIYYNFITADLQEAGNTINEPARATSNQSGGKNV